MGENKRLLNIHEQKFAKLATFQVNTNLFQANTNASIKNLEIQVGQLTLSMQNQSRDSFPSDTKKNPKYYMKVTLISGRGLQKRKEDEENKMTKEKEEAGKENEQNGSELTKERIKFGVQQKQPIEEGKLQKKKEVKVYVPLIPFPQRLQ